MHDRDVFLHTYSSGTTGCTGFFFTVSELKFLFIHYNSLVTVDSVSSLMKIKKLAFLFLNTSLFKIWPLIEQNLNFHDLHYKSYEEVTMMTLWWLTKTSTLAMLVFLYNLNLTPHWNIFRWLTYTTHWHGQFCCWRLFKIWPFNSTPRWPPIKSSWRPERISDQGSLHLSFIKIFWIMEMKKHLSVFEQWPLYDLWPQIPEHPIVPQPNDHCIQISQKIYHRIFEKSFEIVDR